MIKRQETVFIVDDDEALRESIRWLIESVGLQVETYASGNEFLAAYDQSKHACLILDVRMPGISGLDLQNDLCNQFPDLPIIVITGHGDVPMAVRAMKAGAVEFIEKPFNDQMLLECIENALGEEAKIRRSNSYKEGILVRLECLTPREHEVMRRVVDGKSNRDIGKELNISAKTVEVHRSRVMDKMQAVSIAELVKMACDISLFDN